MFFEKLHFSFYTQEDTFLDLKLDIGSRISYLTNMIRDFITTSVGKVIKGLDRFSFPSFYWTWDGKGTYVQGSPDEIELSDSLERFFDIGLSPLCFAGRRFRDVSRLWIAASPFEEERTGAYHEGQIVKPPDGDTSEEVLAFVRWVFDEAFSKKGMRQVLSQMNNAMITYGRTVQGIDWVRGDTPFGEKVFPVDLLDMNPEFFLKDPESYPKGIYVKDSKYQTNVLHRLPDHMMAWGTMHSYFENPYGISEMRILNLIEKYWRKNLLFWAKGNERNGSGAYIGKYGNRLFGKGKESERQTFLDELQKLKSDTVTITHIDNVIEALSASIASDSLQGFHEACGQIISIVLTGSVTALQEGRVGGFSKEEATTTRRKSELEQHDASILCEIFNYQIIPPLVDYNYPGVKSYPRMQLIQPDLIFATTPKDQDKGDDEDVVEVSSGEDEKLRDDKAAKPIKGSQDVKAFAEDDTTKTLPPLLGEVTQQAVEIALKMPVSTRNDFDTLPDAAKFGAFTITAMRNTTKSLSRIERLRDLVAETIQITDEQEAWKSYFRQARAFLREEELAAMQSELFVSFRYARQYAYNQALEQVIEKGMDVVWGIQLLTQDDARVRPQHAKWHGVTRPATDAIWKKIHLPWDFGCRCLKVPITHVEFEGNPGKYTMTPADDVPSIPNSFLT